MKNLVILISLFSVIACSDRSDKPAVKTPPTDNKPADTGRTPPEEQAAAIDIETKVVKSESVLEQKLPEFVTITAKLANPIRVQPTGQDEKQIVSQLQGEIVVQSVEPEVKLRLATSDKVSITAPDLGKCALEMKNFDGIKDSKIQFLLLAVDKKDDLANACTAKLMLMGSTGFIVKFQNVLVDHVGNRVKNVTLKVAVDQQ
jgi:hypothetical protein